MKTAIPTLALLSTLSASLVAAQTLPNIADIGAITTAPSCPEADAQKFIDCLTSSALTLLGKCDVSQLISGLSGGQLALDDKS
ncbi:hypothetical protein HDV05_002779, partial [Chytridiales sp. JEL 0842]